MEAVYAANTRITRLLQDQDGLQWRSKLPPHSHQHALREALKLQGEEAALSSPPRHDQLRAAATGGDDDGGSVDVVAGASVFASAASTDLPSSSSPNTPLTSPSSTHSSTSPSHSVAQLVTAGPVATSSIPNSAQTQVSDQCLEPSQIMLCQHCICCHKQLEVCAFIFNICGCVCR